MSKISWASYYLNIACAAALRSSCERRMVGAAVVNSDNRVVSLGYNDAPEGQPGCESCPRSKSLVPSSSSYDTGPGTCVALHAEQNALLQASRSQMLGGTIYISQAPCNGCRRMIAGSGLNNLVYLEAGEVSIEDASNTP